MTPVIAALLSLIVVRTWVPLAPPPAALIAWLIRLGGIEAGLVYVASLVNSAGLASITVSSGLNFAALAIWTLYLMAVATICGWVWANAIWLLYWVEYAATVEP